MPDLIAISQGFNALKAVTEIVKTIAGARDSVKLLENTIELNQKILSVQTALADAQSEQTTLVQTIRDLEEEVARLKAWDSEKEKYELKDLGHGAFAYARKENAEPSEPSHWLCTKCYADRKKGILQRTDITSGYNNVLWICLECKGTISIGYSIFPASPNAI